MSRAPPSHRLAAPPSPIVFLDIDGVLLPFGDALPGEGGSHPHLFPTRCLAALSKVIAATNATIVLSSTWRMSGEAQQQIINAFHFFAEEVEASPLGHLLDALPIIAKALTKRVVQQDGGAYNMTRSGYATRDRTRALAWLLQLDC